MMERRLCPSGVLSAAVLTLLVITGMAVLVMMLVVFMALFVLMSMVMLVVVVSALLLSMALIPAVHCRGNSCSLTFLAPAARRV